MAKFSLKTEMFIQKDGNVYLSDKRISSSLDLLLYAVEFNSVCENSLNNVEF